MRLKQIHINQYRNFENVTIDLEKNDFSSVYALASINGGGKSTLLQFVFTLLRCFVDEDKHSYIDNLLVGYPFGDKPDSDESKPLVQFVVECDGVEYEMVFSIKVADEFYIIADLREAQQKLQQALKREEKYRWFGNYFEETHKANRVTPFLHRELHELREYRTNDTIKQLWDIANNSDNIMDYRHLVRAIEKSRDFTAKKSEKLQTLVDDLQQHLDSLNSELSEQHLQFIGYVNGQKHALLLKTEMPSEQQLALSNQIFMTAPSSQVYLFLSQANKQDIFRTFVDDDHDGLGNYASNVQQAKQAIGNFFTFDFASTDLIIQAFKNALELDFKEKLKTHKYGNYFDDLKQQLSEFLDSKAISVDEKLEQVVFTMNDGKTVLDPTDLSHGELKKLSLFVWLNYIVPKDSIVLLDEVDIALHPKWQYQLIDDLPKWSANSQFLLATHSPQILSATYYKNLIKLVVEDGKTLVNRFTRPPVDRDMNATVVEVMDAPEMPRALKQLHKEYRALVDGGQQDSEKAKALKALLLEHESENSAFFQDINFDLDMR